MSKKEEEQTFSDSESLPLGAFTGTVMTALSRSGKSEGVLRLIGDFAFSEDFAVAGAAVAGAACALGFSAVLEAAPLGGARLKLRPGAAVFVCSPVDLAPKRPVRFDELDFDVDRLGNPPVAGVAEAGAEEEAGADDAAAGKAEAEKADAEKAGKEKAGAGKAGAVFFFSALFSFCSSAFSVFSAFAAVGAGGGAAKLNVRGAFLSPVAAGARPKELEPKEKSPDGAAPLLSLATGAAGREEKDRAGAGAGAGAGALFSFFSFLSSGAAVAGCGAAAKTETG